MKNYQEMVETFAHRRFNNYMGGAMIATSPGVDTAAEIYGVSYAKMEKDVDSRYQAIKTEYYFGKGK